MIIKKQNKTKKNITLSIVICGIFLSLVVLVNYFFDLFNAFGGYSIPMMLVFYALGIVFIPSIWISLLFCFITPSILLFSGFYLINPVQFLIEYYLCFYIFSFMYLFLFFKNIKNIKIKYLILILLYCFCLVLNFWLHVLAGFYWVENGTILNRFLTSLSINALGSMANNTLTIFPFVLLIYPCIEIFKNYSYLNSYKY